jgi:hypothetical protein
LALAVSGGGGRGDNGGGGGEGGGSAVHLNTALIVGAVAVGFSAAALAVFARLSQRFRAAKSVQSEDSGTSVPNGPQALKRSLVGPPMEEPETLGPHSAFWDFSQDFVSNAVANPDTAI